MNKAVKTVQTAKEKNIPVLEMRNHLLLPIFSTKRAAPAIRLAPGVLHVLHRGAHTKSHDKVEYLEAPVDRCFNGRVRDAKVLHRLQD